MATSKETTSINDQQTPSTLPLLTAPPSLDAENTKNISLGSSETFKLDNLGPLVVNSDGVS